MVAVEEGDLGEGGKERGGRCKEMKPHWPAGTRLLKTVSSFAVVKPVVIEMFSNTVFGHGLVSVPGRAQINNDRLAAAARPLRTRLERVVERRQSRSEEFLTTSLAVLGDPTLGYKWKSSPVCPLLVLLVCERFRPLVLLKLLSFLLQYGTCYSKASLRSYVSVFFFLFIVSAVEPLALWFNFLPLRRGEARKTRNGRCWLDLDRSSETRKRERESKSGVS